MLLEQIGYSAMLATDGFEVLAALEQQPYDLVLMDMQMPRMDGFTAAQKIRQRWGDRPKIIALTAKWLPPEEQAELAMVIHGYLSKPIQLEQLSMLIRCCQSLLSPASLPPILTSAPSLPVTLDRQALERLRHSAGPDGAAVLQQLIDCYLTEAPRQIQIMRQALQNVDALALNHAAHILKSSSAALGAVSLANLCKTLEAYSRVGILDLVDVKLSELEQEFERYKTALRQEHF